MPAPLSVLFVHGVCDYRNPTQWQQAWLGPLNTAQEAYAPGQEIRSHLFAYDDLFAAAPICPSTASRAVWRLLKSGIRQWTQRSSRSLLGELCQQLRWTAGMVVQWLGDDRLRQTLRRRLAQRLLETQATLIVAHSLGSLIAYDLLTDPEMRSRLGTRLSRLHLLTLGSQLAHPLIVGQFGAGRIVMPPIARWQHLYNPQDRVFTAPLRLHDSRFTQYQTPFRQGAPLHHAAVEYLAHPTTQSDVWREVFEPTAITSKRKAPARRPQHRALLVGIDDYPTAEQQLSGCVNDCFLTSSVLQDWIFAPHEIRMLTDQRATAAGMREALTWLLSDVEPNEVRCFFFSGHGAQLVLETSEAGICETHECLVPYDFDWTPQRAIVDDWFQDLYRQLPYEARLLVVLDCCHAGGIAKRPGRRVRGLDPPDDLRHRELAWDSSRELWVPRRAARPAVEASAGETLSQPALRRYGRGNGLQTLPRRTFHQRCRRFGHRGPYLPLVLNACGPDEFAEEYAHGSVSYGAFTYLFAKQLRQAARQREPSSMRSLVASTAEEMRAALALQQTPSAAGPLAAMEWTLPLRSAGRRESTSPKLPGKPKPR